MKAIGGDDEDPHSPETEDALTSPELKVKREDERRPSVTFEDSNSMDAFHSNSNTMDALKKDMRVWMQRTRTLTHLLLMGRKRASQRRWQRRGLRPN